MGIEVFLPRFRASYVKLDKPHPASKKSEKLVYSLVALFDKGTDLSALKKAEAEALKAKFEDKAEAVYKHPKYKSPFKDQSELVDVEGNQRPGTQAGNIFLNLANESKPLIVGPDAQPIIDIRDFYSGCYARAKVEVYSWDHPEGGRGTTFSILGVQKLADGEKLGGTGGRAEVSDFEPVAVEGAQDSSDLFK